MGHPAEGSSQFPVLSCQRGDSVQLRRDGRKDIAESAEKVPTLSLQRAQGQGWGTRQRAVLSSRFSVVSEGIQFSYGVMVGKISRRARRKSPPCPCKERKDKDGAPGRGQFSVPGSQLSARGFSSATA